MKLARLAAKKTGVVVVGAGQAGGRFVESLRANGFEGSVSLVGDEAVRPYERPSLSKEMLLGDGELVTWLHAPEFLAKKEVAFHPGVSVTHIDRLRSKILLMDGREINYGALVLATGARARVLTTQGSADAQCFYLRNLADSKALRPQLRAGRHILIIGAGFIGLEVGSAAIARGCRVTIVEAAQGPVARVAPAEVGATLERLHRQNGVSFRFGIHVEKLENRGNKKAACLSSGETLEADAVVVGVGATPNVELGREAGLEVDRGIIADEFSVTSDPSIFAIGDVAQQYNPLLERHAMLENWQYAQNSAIALAKNLTSKLDPEPYREVPWFWSDQYGTNLQMYGMHQGSGHNIKRQKADGSSLYFQTVNGRLTFAAGFGVARELRPAKDLIASVASISDRELADPVFALADIARQTKQQQQVA